jgi:hypothetical protein
LDQGIPAVEIALGTIPLVGSLFIHGAGMFLVMRAFERHGVPIYRSGRAGQVFFGLMVGIALTTHLVEMLVWAATLVVLGAITTYRDAFYYVAGTYTTLGYGEGTLTKEWRLLGPMIGISGLFAFGWTTGVLVNLVSQAYEERRKGAGGE